MDARIEQVITTGVEHIADAETEIENNTWIIGDDEDVIVIDPAREAPAILEEVGDRQVLAVVCTSGHPDLVGAAKEVAERDEAPIFVHPREKILWRETYPDDAWDEDLAGGGVFAVGDVSLTVLHTPGVSRGAVCLHSSELGIVFTGKTLLAEGPGKVGDDYPDLPSQLTSIGEHLLTLPLEVKDGDDVVETMILPAHGKQGTLASLEPHFDAWVSGRLETPVLGGEEAGDTFTPSDLLGGEEDDDEAADVSDEGSDEAADDMADDVSDEASDDDSDVVSDEASGDESAEVSDEASDDESGEASDQASGRASDEVSDEVSDEDADGSDEDEENAKS